MAAQSKSEAFDDAPHPKAASGVRVGRAEPAGARHAWIPRTALFLPRWTLEVVFAPVRGGLWAYERYDLRERARSIFFNEDGTVGLYPVALIETGFGINAGLRFVHRDLFGDAESLKLRASYGGRFQQLYSARFRTEGRLALELDAELEIRPKDQFYGYGNRDLVGTSFEVIDPRGTGPVVESRYSQTVTSVRAAGDARLVSRLFAELSAGFVARDYGEPDDDTDDPSTQMAYAVDQLAGFGTGTRHLYGELELRWDSRRSMAFGGSQAVPSTGWLAEVFVGRAAGIGRSEALGFWRYGFDLQRYLNILNHRRALTLRLLGEAVSAPIGEMPPGELPRLGGPLLLRGYDQDRFRDRVAGLASAEYAWELAGAFAAVAFVDAGRVWRSGRALRDELLDDVRIGYGVGLQMHSKKSFLGRFHVASSTDGGLFVNLSFDPVYDTRSRLERK